MSIREILIDWLTSSRYVKWLERSVNDQRAQYVAWIEEKNRTIAKLETELAAQKLECDRMRLILMPLGSPAGKDFAQRFMGHLDPPKPMPVPDFDGPLDWPGELARMIEQEELETKE